MDNYADRAVTMMSDLLRKASVRGSIEQGVITAVDKDNNTCTVTTEASDGTILTRTRVPLRVLTTDSNYMIYPKVGTDCALAFYGSRAASPVILDFQDAESVKVSAQTLIEIDAEQMTLNGGELGGLIKIQTLTDKLNALVSTFNSHTHTVAGVMAGSASVEAAPTTEEAAQFVSNDYEDEKITH